MVEKFDVTIPPDPTESRPRGHEFGPGSVAAPTRAWQKWAFCFWSSLGIYLKADDTAKSGAMREDASSVPMVCSAASAVVTHDRFGATQRRRFPRGKKHRYQKVSLSQEPLLCVTWGPKGHFRTVCTSVCAPAGDKKRFGPFIVGATGLRLA